MTVIKFVCSEIDSNDVEWSGLHHANVPGRLLLRDILLRFEKMSEDKALRYEFPDKKTADKFRGYVVNSTSVRKRMGGRGVFKSRVTEENDKGVLYIAPGPKFERGPHNMKACKPLFEGLV